jgi:hypothetical protein
MNREAFMGMCGPLGLLASMRVSPNAQAVAEACKLRVLRVVQANFLARLKLLATILAEYRRAIAAARRYDELKLHRESAVRRHDIPRRIFEEFYSQVDGGSGRLCSGPR